MKWATNASCKNGENCPNRHVGDGKTKSILCKRIAQGLTCVFGDNCAYSHSKKLLPAAPATAEPNAGKQDTQEKKGGKKKPKAKPKPKPAMPAVRVIRPVKASGTVDRNTRTSESEDQTVDRNTRRDLKPAAPSVKCVEFDPNEKPCNDEVPPESVRRWLCDTGCMFDLVSRDTVNTDPDCILEAVEDPEELYTANGPVKADTTGVIPVYKFSDYIEPFVLDDTPDVMSIGTRCVDKGYEFHWPAFDKYPYFVTPGGQKVYLTVVDSVPYLYDEKAPKAIRKFPACPAPMVRPANSSDPKPSSRGKGSGSKPASPGSSRGSDSSSDQDWVAVPAVTGSKSEPSASGEVESSKASKETVEKKKSHPPKASGASSSSKPLPTPEGGVSSPNACGSKDIPPSDTAASGEADPVSVPDAPAPTERRNLKKEAESPEHLLTHRPYNPFLSWLC